MNKSQLHRNLKRQLDKFLPEEFIEQNPNLLSFIQTVNQTYFNYEKDAELFEQSARLNDKEYGEVNAKLKEELEKSVFFQKKLIEAIKQLNAEGQELGDEENLLDLLHILHKEIEIKAEIQRQLYASIAEAEDANEAKSEFLSIMSHEIRTPLNAIIGLIYIMEKENSLQSFHENIGVLKHSAQNLFLLINNILDFSKIEAGKVDIEKIPFNLVELVKQIARSLEARASENLNVIEVKIDPDFIPNLISDPLRITQVITNLISNAIKFTQNGKISIRLHQILVNEKISSFKIEVIDTGIGIDKDKFQSIFQKFSQA